MEKLKALQRLEDSLAKLPGVGRKSAERMAYKMLEMDEEDLLEFASSIQEIKQTIHHCPICGAYTDMDECEICKDESRDHSTILVVSAPKDVLPFENSNEYRGVYHVLGGDICISKGGSIDSLNTKPLLDKAASGEVKEIILATNPTLDGETTALYIAKLLKDYPVNITRLAYGLPMGGNIDYADALTLSRALEGRRKL